MKRGVDSAKKAGSIPGHGEAAAWAVHFLKLKSRSTSSFIDSFSASQDNDDVDDADIVIVACLVLVFIVVYISLILTFLISWLNDHVIADCTFFCLRLSFFHVTILCYRFFN